MKEDIRSQRVFLVLLGLFTDRNGAFLYPFIYFSQGIATPFFIPEAARVASPYWVFSLTWLTSGQICWNKRMRLHKKRVQLPQDWFATQTWPPFHCFGTQIWPPWRHVKTHNRPLCGASPEIKSAISDLRNEHTYLMHAHASLCTDVPHDCSKN